MKKLALTIGFASALMLASVPAKANQFLVWPWGVVGALGINLAVSETVLIACHHRVTQNLPELFVASLPIIGPYEAIKSCKPRK